MSNSEHVDSVITEALAKARKGAADAGYGAGIPDPARQARERFTEVIGAKLAATVRRTQVLPSELLGVSVSLSGTQVLVTYPAEYRRSVSVPVAWLLYRTVPTDSLIARDIDPGYLATVVLTGQA